MTIKRLKAKIDEYSDYLMTNGSIIASELLTETIQAAAIPMISSSIMLYKQKRFEKNTIELIEQLITSHEEIEKRLEKFEKPKLDFVKEKLFPLTLDYVVDEKQLGKIKYYANVFKNIIRSEVTISDLTGQGQEVENVLILCHDILSELTLYDIEVLFSVSLIKEEEKIPNRELNPQSLIDISLKYTLSKLKQLNLIIKAETWGDLGGEGEYVPENLSEIKLTALGAVICKLISDKL